MPNFIVSSRRGGYDLLDLEVLGDRIREKPLAHLARRTTRALGVGRARLEHDVTADAHVGDLTEAERVQRSSHGLPLRVEDAPARDDANLDTICGHAVGKSGKRCL